MTAAMVLCAGLGTRLRPLTDELAKPLLPVGDRPALLHILESLRASGIADIAINTHHRAGDFPLHLGALLDELHVFHEPEILGTAGGVAQAAAALGEGEALIWNGDIVAPSLAVEDLLERWRRAGSEIVWVVEPLETGAGTVGLDERGNIVRLRGERFGEEVRAGHFLGIQIMSARLRASLPGRGCLVGDVALPLLRAGGQIGSFRYDGVWDDVGSPAGLLRANLRWLEQRRASCWSADDAIVEAGVRLEESVVSRRARIMGSGVVRECVVLPGATLVAPAHRTVAGRTGRAQVDARPPAAARE